MEAKDLMIGDWVYDTILQGYTRVKVLTARGIQGDIHDNIWDEDTFAPIPLTPEILEKNGFKVYEQDFTSNNVYKFGCFDFMEFDRFYKCFNIGSKITYRGCGREVTYIHSLMQIHFVHQLQHALRLCGIKKEIVL